MTDGGLGWHAGRTVTPTCPESGLEHLALRLHRLQCTLRREVVRIGAPQDCTTGGRVVYCVCACVYIYMCVCVCVCVCV
jgi:hypothetical protein